MYELMKGQMSKLFNYPVHKHNGISNETRLRIGDFAIP